MAWRYLKLIYYLTMVMVEIVKNLFIRKKGDKKQ